jgi:N-acetylmuramoyl-L-alanine amidase
VLLVRKVEGPATSRPGETLVFRAVAFNQASPSEAELAEINWLIEADGQELVRRKAGASIAFTPPAELTGKAIIAMAFRNSPARHVSAVTVIQPASEQLLREGLERIRAEFHDILAGDLDAHPAPELADRTLGLRFALDDLIDSARPLPNEDDEPVEAEVVLADDAPRLAIVVGHTKAKSGAAAIAPISQAEYHWNLGVADRMEDAARAAGIATKICLRDNVGIRGAYETAAAFQPAGIIELHFNSFDTPTVRGTETLHSEDHPKSRLLAERVHGAMIEALRENGGDRGIKVRRPGDRGHGNVSARPDFPSVLVEPFFGSNPAECRLVHERVQQYAEGLVSAFRKFVDAG